MKTSLPEDYLYAWRGETLDEYKDWMASANQWGMKDDMIAEVQAIFLEKIRIIDVLLEGKLAE